MKRGGYRRVTSAKILMLTGVCHHTLESIKGGTEEKMATFSKARLRNRRSISSKSRKKGMSLERSASITGETSWLARVQRKENREYSSSIAANFR